MQLKFNTEQIEYMLRQERFPEVLRLRLKEAHSFSGKKTVELTLSEDEAERMREVAAQLLQENGFDEKYDVTVAGRILEDLIELFE